MQLVISVTEVYLLERQRLSFILLQYYLNSGICYFCTLFKLFVKSSVKSYNHYQKRQVIQELSSYSRERQNDIAKRSQYVNYWYFLCQWGTLELSIIVELDFNIFCHILYMFLKHSSSIAIITSHYRRQTYIIIFIITF